MVKNGSGKIEEKRSWEGRRERERKGERRAGGVEGRAVFIFVGMATEC